MIMLTEDQRRPVLSIDLGASYTKLAWRNAWNGEEWYNSLSESIQLHREKLYVPSLAFDPGEGRKWVFGEDAAKLVPGKGGRLHRNWKADIFSADDNPHSIAAALEVAERYLNWLRLKLLQKKDSIVLKQALVRFSVPAFGGEEGRQGEARLRQAAVAAGFDEQPVKFTSEPKSNIIGLASAGRNCVKNGVPQMGEIYDSPWIEVENRARASQTVVKMGIIDLGSFSTDLAVCERRGDWDIKVLNEYSFRHGVFDLDKAFKKLSDWNGVNAEQLPAIDFETAKHKAYGGTGFSGMHENISYKLNAGCMMGDLRNFAYELLTKIQDIVRNCSSFILTGGGFEITEVRHVVKARLEELDLTDIAKFFPEQDARLATAVGGASVFLSFGDDEENQKGNAPVCPTSSGQEVACSCGGKNKDCARCSGKGTLPEKVREKSVLKPRQRENAFEKQKSKAPLQTGDLRPDSNIGSISNIGTPNVPASTRLTIKGQRSPRIPVEPNPVVSRITLSDIRQCWIPEKAVREFGLEGWMGHLVFGATLKPVTQKGILLDHSSIAGKAAWLRLLCLGTCLGVRTKRKVVKDFWENKLGEIWPVFVPIDLRQAGREDYLRQLDKIFESAIHRQFTDVSASGEAAELWRRVFYDFRKLHHYVYQNGFAQSILELAESPGVRYDSLLNFLKSGLLPGGGGRWSGVLGQSMTAPIFFVLRELRRLEVIDVRFARSCFYMNSPARQIARKLGWLSERESGFYDIERLSQIGDICFKSMRDEMAELLPYFDLPLQWYAFKNPS